MIYTALILLAVSLCLLALELFLPSAGVLGLLAGCLTVAAVVIGFMIGLQTGLILLISVMLAMPAVLLVMIKIWPRTPIGRKILTDESTLTDILPQGEFYEKTTELLGQTGIAKSKMLPSGQIVIDGQKYDAVSDGFAIASGDTIQVVAIKQNRIYVQPVLDAPSAQTSQASDAPLDQPIENFDLDADSIDELLGE